MRSTATLRAKVKPSAENSAGANGRLAKIVGLRRNPLTKRGLAHICYFSGLPLSADQEHHPSLSKNNAYATDQNPQTVGPAHMSTYMDIINTLFLPVAAMSPLVTAALASTESILVDVVWRVDNIIIGPISTSITPATSGKWACDTVRRIYHSRWPIN